MPSRIARYISIYAALFRISLIQEMQFKLNFLLWIVVEGLWFFLQLAFMTVLYSHTDSIAGWSKWEVVLLVGCSQFIQQIFSILFLTNLTQLSELIRTGKLDFFLLLPVNARFLISTRKFEIGNVANALMGLAVVAYAAIQLQLRPGFPQLVGFAFFCLAGTVLHYSLMYLLACVAFFTVKAQGIVWGYYNLFNIARLPDTAFRGAYRAFFTWVIPVILVANVPSRILLGKLGEPGQWMLMIGLCGTAFLISEIGWRLAIRNYTSASS